MKAACAALLILAAAGAGAQSLPAGGYRSPPPRVHGGGGGFHGFPGAFFPIESQVVYVEREVIREVPVAPAAPPSPPPPPRKPWALGASYDSLPSGCMKMLSDGAAFYNCSGEWYRQVAAHSYKAVEGP
jgi:hypothetical protein